MVISVSLVLDRNFFSSLGAPIFLFSANTRGLMGERVDTLASEQGRWKTVVLVGERDPAARGIGVKCHHTRQHARAMRPTLLKLDCQHRETVTPRCEVTAPRLPP